MKRLALVLLLSSFAFAGQPCATKFSVVYKDPLNNFKQGLAPEDLKWFEAKIARKYPEICYQAPIYYPPLVFFVAISTSTYNGTKTESSSHNVTDQYGQDTGIRTTSQSTVPYSFDYPLLTMSLESRDALGKYRVLHNFQRKGICPTLYGVCFKHKHPQREIIEDAMKWINAGGLTDPMQTVLVPGEQK